MSSAETDNDERVVNEPREAETTAPPQLELAVPQMDLSLSMDSILEAGSKESTKGVEKLSKLSEESEMLDEKLKELQDRLAAAEKRSKELQDKRQQH